MQGGVLGGRGFEKDSQVIWWRNLEDSEEKRCIPQPRGALDVVSKLPEVPSIVKTQQIITCLPHFLLLNEHSSRNDEI